MIKTLERPWVRVATVMVFVPFYIFFVNYQGCRAIQCSVSEDRDPPMALYKERHMARSVLPVLPWPFLLLIYPGLPADVQL